MPIGPYRAFGYPIVPHRCIIAGAADHSARPVRYTARRRHGRGSRLDALGVPVFVGVAALR